MNHKKLRRLYAEERLQVRRRGGRKQGLARSPMTLRRGRTSFVDRWISSRDMVTDGRRFRILVVVDDFTRGCLALVADTSLSGVPVAPRTRCAHSRGAQGAAVRQPQRHRTAPARRS